MRLAGLALALAALLCTACVNITIPLDTDLDRTQLGPKVGRASIHTVLLLFAWGDGGTEAAARQGGITTITHADQQVFALGLIVYARRTTIVYGD